MPVHIADDPLTCVAIGAGLSLEELDSMKRRRRASQNHRARQRQRQRR
jgi:actin-like ATPase involved in cell morphogenesis